MAYRDLLAYRWRRWARDGGVALLGGAMGFLAVYLLRAPQAPAPLNAVVQPASRAPRDEQPKAYVVQQAPPAAQPLPAAARRRRAWRRAPAPNADAALARAYAEDALVTKRLNEAAMASLTRGGGGDPDRR